MAVRTRRRSTFRQTTVVNNEPPTPANAAAVWWADDIAQSDGSAVASWTDRVNNISVSQATSGARPTYDIDGLNGRSSVSFDGIDDHLSSVASDAVSVATQGCVIAVIRRTSGDGRVWSSAQHAAGPNYITGRFSSGVPSISQSSNGGANEDLVMGQTSAGTSNTVVEWSSNGTQYSFRLANAPGSQTVSSGANTGDWFGDTPGRNNLTIGAIKYGVGGNTISFLYAGQLAYLGVFNSPLSSQDRYDLYKWIEEYYGINNMPGLSDYEHSVLLDGPSAFWPMQETSGDLTDVTGNGYVATKVGSGGVTYLADGPSASVKSIEFAGSSGVGYSAADNNLWSSTNFTVEGWIYLASSFFGAQPARYFLTKHSSGVANEWFTMIENASGRRIIAQVCNTADTTWANKIDGPTWGAESTWYHVAWSLSSSTVTLYVNGAPVGSSGGYSGSRATNASGVLSIGHGPAVAGRSWNGRMSMVAFYDYTLTQPQIQAHYEAMTT